MCQTTNTSWVCATCSVSILDKKSVKVACQDYKDQGFCTVALTPLNEYVYVDDPDCEICKQMNHSSDDEKNILKKMSKKMCMA